MLGKQHGRADPPAGITTAPWAAVGQSPRWGQNISAQGIPPEGEFAAIAAGWYYTCGLRTDNTPHCWGYLGGDTPPDGEFSSMAAGGYHTCLLRNDLAVNCFGWNESGQADPPEETFIALAAGEAHTCGLRADLTITCWGRNDFGQTDPPSGKFLTIAASWDYSCGLRSDLTITCWGRIHRFFDPPPGEFIAISAGSRHAYGIRTDNTIDCWGSHPFGEATSPDGKFIAMAPDGSTPAGCVPTRASPAGVMPTQFLRPTMCVSSHDRRETRKAGDRSGNYDLEAAAPNSSRAALRPDTLSGSPDIIRVSSATLPSPLTSLTDAEAPWRSITQC